VTVPRLFAACCAGALLVAPASLAAQEPEVPQRWGVSATFVPSWKVPSGDSPLAKLGELVLTSGDGGLGVTGGDFRIGVVRGRHLEGDWGVSYVRRTFEDGSFQGEIVNECPSLQNCSVFGERYIYQGVTLDGIEANKFITFGTIQNTVQIGVDISIGVGWLKGTAEKTEARTEFIQGPPPQFQGQIVPIIETSQVPATELSTTDPTLLGRAELAAAVILPRGLKVRVSGGMNYPGQHTLGVVIMYFFGQN
jgi:hypothetical protein